MYKDIEKIKQLLSNPIQQDGTYEVYQLEQKLANHYDKNYCLLMSNASMALLTCFKAASIYNEHIIAPAFGWSGSIAAPLHLNNKISLAAVDERYCLDPSKIETLISPNTKAILSIDTGGYAADSKRISELAKAEGLLYISDSAESLGAKRDGKAAGAFADVVIVSFTNGKTINAGEMGALITNEEWLFNEAVKLSQHPHRQKKVLGITEWYPFSPFNTRVHPLAAIIGNAEFDKLDTIVKERRDKALEVLKHLTSQSVVRPFDLCEEESTFFELFLKGIVTQSVYDKCDKDNFWYLDNDLSNYNLIALTKKYYSSSFLKSNAVDLEEQIRNLIKIQFDW
jgi:dTDP-4-amino-4,6-dideoxygalactose transaminase